MTARRTRSTFTATQPCAARSTRARLTTLTALLALVAPAAAATSAPTAQPPRDAVREPLRDPMRVPGAAVPRGDAAGPAAAPSPPPPVRQLLVVDGQRYVVDGARRRGVGDALGDARIERIDDDAVLLRRGGELLRVPLFAGVTRRVSRDDGAPGGAATPAPAPSPSPARRPQPAVQRP